MVDFALITEGQTDQAVLENILYGYFGEDDIDVNPLQPRTDKTGSFYLENQSDQDAKRNEYGTWGNVFWYCRSELFRSIFQNNDFVIIQLDTDVSEQDGFKVMQTFINSDGERENLTVEELIQKVQERIIYEIDKTVHERFKDRIFFAICVDSIECWLLPIFCSDGDKKATKTQGCFKALNRQLEKTNNKRIPISKPVRRYADISQPYSKKKVLLQKGVKNRSLKIFLDSLAKLDIEDME
ncbi:hypothetical protein Lepto7376_1161 [[Leptolyngbya] sp. PCC 7376]|uniref:hypothetical protein n=1 Tax=[Leptolyngbya] sp. PCC 7376 TaxID=111781 RepID=UPI00029ED16E|nr:hypothetical protein [[Leptolyngbya] sp. PCC 7376]AFY37524.1 hypothetical protein Lepto7376_1161 [[Leptolyngbya] sp. PCC 7376]